MVAVTAPTGTAAYNVSGATLHGALHIPMTNSSIYQKLSHDKCNSLRVKAGSLKLLIIDEISMVSNNMLMTINHRLCEIKSSTELFGGVSIIAIGDLYQLPPVSQMQIFKPLKNDIASIIPPLWHEFKIAELELIMRQKEDTQFAELLNRLRKGKHTDNDIETLMTRNIPLSCEKKTVLHIFPTNEQVDNHNSTMLNQLPGPIIKIKAKDHIPQGVRLNRDDKMNSGLFAEIDLAINCRVMMVRNILTEDGLVNGVHGKVKYFTYDTNNNVNIIFVAFDDPKVGQKTRTQTSYAGLPNEVRNYTPIKRCTVNFTSKKQTATQGASRSQFPIKLAFACTIHKVQGLTMEKIFVCFKGTYRVGQAYVALSRCKSIQGLFMSHFEKKKVVTGHEVALEMNRMIKYSQLTITSSPEILPNSTCLSTLCMVNVRSFHKHLADIVNDDIFMTSDLIVLSETWCLQTDIIDLSKHGLKVIRADKPAVSHSQRTAGGIMILVKDHIKYVVEQHYATNHMQILKIKIFVHSSSIIVTAMYRSPSSPNNSDLSSIIYNLFNHPIKQHQIVLGDMNEDILKINGPRNISSTFDTLGFQQQLTEPTHYSGGTPSIIDHVYTKNMITSNIITSSYFSDHRIVKIKCFQSSFETYYQIISNIFLTNQILLQIVYLSKLIFCIKFYQFNSTFRKNIGPIHYL